MATTHRPAAAPDNLPRMQTAHVRLMTLYRAARRHVDGQPLFVRRIDIEVISGAPLPTRLLG